MVYGDAMADVRIEHTYDCSVDTFWNQVFFEEDYNRRLFKEALKFPVWEIKKNEDQGNRIERVVEVVPKLADLPAPIKKVVGENVGYREEGVFDKTTKRYRINIVPNTLADKLKVQGELWVEPQGSDKCKRIFQATVTAKIFGIGGMIEKRLISDMQESYAAGARFTNQYISEKGLK
jgi:hypothetical protein